MLDVHYNASFHRIAQLTTGATLLLIFMGGLVTSHGAGMSVPDWPNSYGYNMFTFPPSRWIGGIFYEHTHRLMGTVVGLLTIVLTVIAWAKENRLWVRWLATAALVVVILQGVLGGLRVIWDKLDLAIVHACVAQAFLCLVASIATASSRWWLTTGKDNTPDGNGLIGLCIACVVAVFAQLVLGALMRHYGAGLAIPDFPLNYGRLLPPTDQAALESANQQRVGLQLTGVSLGQIWLHFAHRLGAVIVTILLLVTVRRATATSDRAIRTPAVMLLFLLAVQITLGILTVLWRKPADVASLHVVVGAHILMSSFVLLLRTARIYSPKGPEVRISPQYTMAPA